MTDLDHLAELAADILHGINPTATTALGDDPAAALRPVVQAVLHDEAAQRWADQQLAETKLRSADFRNGIAMDIEPARESVARWVGAARAMLGEAPNYTETPIEMHVKVAESPERFAFVLQRVAPGALTPHQARQRAETALAEVLGIVAAWCVEANDIGGVDAGDLAWRLKEAGHQLPDTDEADTETPAAAPARQLDEGTETS